MSTENDILAQSSQSGASAANDRLAFLLPPQPDSAELTVTCKPGDFLASAIARAVEDCNAHLINLNVTGSQSPDGSLLVHLRVNRRVAGPVARSLERHGYPVVDGDDGVTESPYDQILAERAGQLLHILNL